MAKTTQFKARILDTNDKCQHTIPTPPHKITESELKEGEWRVSKPQRKAKSKTTTTTKKHQANAKTKTKRNKKLPRRASDLLRCVSEEYQCLHCQQFSDSKSCTLSCYRAFRKENFLPSTSIHIRGPGPDGYGAFLSRSAPTIPKHSYVGEYLGDLRPLSALDTSDSLYIFEIPSLCIVDAERAGNWTRYINSSCAPNVKPWGATVGKRHVIVFQALRDIEVGEELVFDYGKRYFEKARFLCACGVQGEEHMPEGAKKKGKGKGKK